MSGTLPASVKWPNVPACYGWLSLDRRGRWRLQGETVSHRGLIAFLEQGYAHDEQGRWFVQNGPQRVFVSLEYTPWIVRLDDGQLSTHIGQAVSTPEEIFIDDSGSILLAWRERIALLDDRDLPAFLSDCRTPANRIATEDEFLALMAGESCAIQWHDLPLQTIRADELAPRFGFQPEPAPDA